MHGIDEAVVVETARQGSDRLTNLLDAVAEVLPPVPGNQHQRAPPPRRSQTPVQLCVRRRAHPVVPLLDGDFHPQRVDDGIPGHRDGGVWHSFAEQRLACRGGGREMQRHDLRGELTVHLFREGRPDVSRSQAGLDVADGNPPVEAAERGHQHRGGIALHQRQVR